MSARFRWYRVTSTGRTPLRDALLSNPFRSDKEYGFREIETELDFADVRFLCRNEVIVTDVAADGTPQYSRVETINILDFMCVPRGAHTFIRLINSPRDVRRILSAMESIVGLGFTAQPLTFERKVPSAVFKGVDIASLVAAKVLGALASEELLARIDLASKRGIALDKMRLLSGLDYRIESATYEMQYKGQRGSFSYSRGGSVKLAGQLAPRLLTLVESDLLKAKR